MTESGLEEITLVPEPTEKKLTEKQLVDYRAHREQLLKWLLHFGKKPDEAEGYSVHTLKIASYRIDKFYRWVWEENGYTTRVTTGVGDDYLRELAYSDDSDAHKSKCLKALKMLYKWREYQRGGESWNPDISFSSGGSADNPRDYFTRDERAKLREAALEYGSIPSYKSVTPEERSRWKRYLAQRFEKPKEEVCRDDWRRANSWKITSLVWTSLDTGLRPIEVGRARTSWVDLENDLLRIPKEESSKNYDNWTVSLSNKTGNVLENWLEERNRHSKYEGTDALWLTRRRNEYCSSSLKYTLEKLCEEAGIPTEDRKISWYSIRHSVGTYMTREEGLAAAQAQLRHKCEQTTMKYDQVPVEDRRGALDKMG